MPNFDAPKQCTPEGDDPLPTKKEKIEHLIEMGTRRRMRGEHLREELYKEEERLGYDPDHLLSPHWKGSPLSTYSADERSKLTWQERFQPDTREQEHFEQARGELELLTMLVRYTETEHLLGSTDEMFDKPIDLMEKFHIPLEEGLTVTTGNPMLFIVSPHHKRGDFERLEKRILKFIHRFPEGENHDTAVNLLRRLYETRLSALYFYREVGEVKPEIFGPPDDPFEVTSEELTMEIQAVRRRAMVFS